MKKVLYPVAIATLIFVSCGKENVAPIDKDAPIIEEIVEPAAPALSLNASFEELQKDTKADINGSNQLVWAGGDKIGVYVNDVEWGDKNQPFHLDGAGGTTSGTFIWDYDNGNFTNQKASVAFFPWNGTNGATDNNVYEGTMYFKLPGAYYGYTSGKMLTPLVAPMHYNGSTYDNVQFKHAGAAVKVTINNLPAGAHSIGMSIDGKQISGDFHINPANAGTDAMSLDNPEDNSKNSVWLNFSNSSETAYTFLFPVPALSSPKPYFQIYDENDILVWSANPPAQNSIGRAQVLVMPPLTITPYSYFTVDGIWSITGQIKGENKWGTDYALYDYGDAHIIMARMEFNDGDEFKIRKERVWGEEYPASNYKINGSGTYTIRFNTSTHVITAEKDGVCPYPIATQL